MKRNSPIALVMTLALCLALTLVPGVAVCDDFDEVEVSEVVVIDAAAEGECESEEVLADDAGADKTEASASEPTVVGDAGADEAEVAAVEPEATIVEDEAGVEAEPEAEEKNEDVTLVSNVAYTSNAQGHWLVTGEYTGGALQRYWVQADGTFATNRLISPDEGAGYWAYAKSDGTVVRGKYTASNGYVYLADNDGRLESTGWLVTNKYDGGLQRYWIDEDAHAAIPGYSTDGWAHLTTTSGYVLRGAGTYNASKYYANNDGLITVSGWVVTGDFTSGKLQRYWAGTKGAFVTSTLITPADGAGYYAYAKPDATVVRGKYTASNGYVYLADNDGRLESTGWLVTKTYDGGLQRYWIDKDAHAAIPGYSTDGWAHLTTTSGYVLRGAGTYNGSKYYANNDGLITVSGWVVTGDFTSGKLQRYWAGTKGAFVTSTLITPADGAGYCAYAKSDGTVVRGKYDTGKGYVYLADNDGRLTTASDWLVTSTYDSGLQRYYIDAVCTGGLHGAKVGYFEVDGSSYYGLESDGYVARNRYCVHSSTAYYADNDGKLQDASEGFLGSDGAALLAKYWSQSSTTKYMLIVDVESCYTYVFQGSAKNWTPIYKWLCSTEATSYNNGEGMPRGKYTIGGNGADYNWVASGKYTPGGAKTTYWAINDVKYFSGFNLNLGFHSTIGNEGGYSDSNQLGKRITHGCIRLLEANAKWIYVNCDLGTKVIVC